MNILITKGISLIKKVISAIKVYCHESSRNTHHEVLSLSADSLTPTNHINGLGRSYKITVVLYPPVWEQEFYANSTYSTMVFKKITDECCKFFSKNNIVVDENDHLVLIDFRKLHSGVNGTTEALVYFTAK